jgi:phenylacetate-coenzyme A ligase PaaK-like adenylate-forming protein
MHLVRSLASPLLPGARRMLQAILKLLPFISDEGEDDDEPVVTAVRAAPKSARRSSSGGRGQPTAQQQLEMQQQQQQQQQMAAMQQYHMQMQQQQLSYGHGMMITPSGMASTNPSDWYVHVWK